MGLAPPNREAAGLQGVRNKGIPLLGNLGKGPNHVQVVHIDSRERDRPFFRRDSI